MSKPDTSKEEDNDENRGGQTSEVFEKKEVNGKDEQQTEESMSSAINESRMDESDKSKLEENGQPHSDQNMREVEKIEKEVVEKETPNAAIKRSKSASSGRRSKSRAAKLQVLSWQEDDTEEEESNDEHGKGKRTPKRKAPQSTPSGTRKTPLNAWYNGCEFYCPKDEEGLCGTFPHKDSFTKHWKRNHGGAAANVPTDPRNVIKMYQCQKCLKNVHQNRDMIYKHLKASHKMSFAEYEKEFHPDQAHLTEHRKTGK